jgi:hypothetical protein
MRHVSALLPLTLFAVAPAAQVQTCPTDAPIVAADLPRCLSASVLRGSEIQSRARDDDRRLNRRVPRVPFVIDAFEKKA